MKHQLVLVSYVLHVNCYFNSVTNYKNEYNFIMKWINNLISEQIQFSFCHFITYIYNHKNVMN